MTPEPRAVRRQDRAQDEAFIVEAFARIPWGTLAVADGAGPPHVNTNLFVHRGEPDRIYLHTARTGALAEAVQRAGEAGAAASFTAAVMGKLLPADEALEFSVEYAGVTATGRLVLVDEDAEAERALQALLDRYAPHLRAGRDYRPIIPGELARTAVYRLDVDAWSGKQKAVDAHEGAFRLPMPVPPIEPG